MAITSTLVPNSSFLLGNISGSGVACGTIAGPASYATGGFAIDPETDLNFSDAIAVFVESSSDAYSAKWISGTGKIKVLKATDSTASNIGTEVANTTDISSVTFTLLVVGSF